MSELKSGDYYTFIHDEPLLNSSGKPVAIGDYRTRIVRTDKPAEVFRLIEFHRNKVKIDPEDKTLTKDVWAYEYVFLGHHVYQTGYDDNGKFAVMTSKIVSTNGEVVLDFLQEQSKDES